jgi:pyruvate dehydrogenase E1 component alpha subunit
VRDFCAFRSKLLEARERARKESRPTVLEVKTYRFYGFHIADASHKKYRSPEEIDFHKEHRDPITHWGDQLRSEGLLEKELESAIHRGAKQEALAAVDFSSMSAEPRKEDLTKDVYWEVDHETESSQQGRHFFNDEDLSGKPPMRPS